MGHRDTENIAVLAAALTGAVVTAGQNPPPSPVPVNYYVLRVQARSRLGPGPGR
jgi:hypothetical protein